MLLSLNPLKKNKKKNTTGRQNRCELHIRDETDVNIWLLQLWADITSSSNLSSLPQWGAEAGLPEVSASGRGTASSSLSASPFIQSQIWGWDARICDLVNGWMDEWMNGWMDPGELWPPAVTELFRLRGFSLYLTTAIFVSAAQWRALRSAARHEDQVRTYRTLKAVISRSKTFSCRHKCWFRGVSVSAKDFL